jgi:hypothetical protein
MLSAGTKADIRRHMGIPVAGINAGGVQLGYRFETRVGDLEYRMINLQPYEEATITGQPIGSIQITGVPEIGDPLSITMTPPTGSPVVITYDVTEQDIQAIENAPGFLNNGPLYSVAQNLARAINLNPSPFMAAANPPVDLEAAPGYGPTYAEVLVQAIALASFTLAATGTGETGAIVTAQGNPIFPQVTFSDYPGGAKTLYGYIPILNYLDSNVFSRSNAFLSFSQADVVKFRPDEIDQRTDLYENARQRLADYFGVPLYAAGRQRPGGGGGSIA